MGNDFRYALRTLGRNRSFTVIATLTLALGIGLNAAIFGIINGLILKPVAAGNIDRLVWIASASSDGADLARLGSARPAFLGRWAGWPVPHCDRRGA